MNMTKARKLLTALATILAAVLTLTAPDDANAALATLVSCQMSQMNNQYVYLGTYSLNGQMITLQFTQYCPPSVNL